MSRPVHRAPYRGIYDFGPVWRHDPRKSERPPMSNGSEEGRPKRVGRVTGKPVLPVSD